MEKDCILLSHHNTQPKCDHPNRKRRDARAWKLEARNDAIDKLNKITNQINEAAAHAKELRMRKKQLQSTSSVKRTKAKPGMKVAADSAVATPQSPVAGPSQFVQVPELSDSEDFKGNHHEDFNGLDVFPGNPSPAHSLVLHCPTNPFTFESTPTRRLQSPTYFGTTQNNTPSSPYFGYRLPAPNSSPTQSFSSHIKNFTLDESLDPSFLIPPTYDSLAL